MECFGAETPRLSVAQVAKLTGLDRATARRCLLTLNHEGYADYDGKFFTPTTRVLRLGTGTLASLPLPQVAQPWLDQLSQRIGESVSISCLDGTEIVYLARAAQVRVMSIGLMPGSRLPAHCTSMGRVLLAALPQVEARGILEGSDLTPRTSRSLTDVAAILAELEAVFQNGFSLVDQEVELGLRSLAVPVHNSHGHVIAALNVGVAAVQSHAEQLISDYLEELLRVQSGLRKLLS